MPRRAHSASKSALNSDPPSTWMAWMGKGMSAWSLSRKSLALCALARRKAWAQVHLASGSQAVDCLSVRRSAPRETLRVSSWTISPGRLGLRPLGRGLAWGRLRRTLQCRRRRRMGTGTTRPRATSIARMRPVVLSETTPALAVQQDGQLGLAPHRIVAAHRLDRIHQRRRPVRPAQPVRPPRARLGTLRPAIEGGTRHADRLCGIGGTQSPRPGTLPADERIGA